MHVLIDGHNAMGALKVAGKTHEARRRALLRRVARLARRVTVFFDARNAPPDTMDATSELGVDVRYCRRREADAAILEAVRDADAPGRLLVVTNDREVAGRAGQLGAHTVGVVSFFGPGPERGSGLPPPEEPPPRLPDIHPRFTPRDFGLPDEVDLENPDLGEDE